METRPKALLVALVLAASSPLLVAQAPPLERPGTAEGPRWGQEMRPWGGRPVYHHWGGRMGMRGPTEFALGGLVSNPELRERLGITSEQASKIRQQGMDYRKAQIRNRADLEVKRMELAELLGADKPDRALIDKKLREITETQFAAEKSAIDYRLAMREALTPEQREKLKQMVSEFRRRRTDSGFRRFGPRGPERMGSRGPRGTRPPGESQGPPRAQKPAPPTQPGS